LLRLLVGLVPDPAVQDDLGPVALRRGDLGRRGVLGHADDRADSVDLRRQGDSLRVVSRRGADDAAPLLLLRHQGELVQRPADLVGPDPLEHLRLQTHVEAASLRELARRQQRSPPDVLRDALARLLEIRQVERKHQKRKRWFPEPVQKRTPSLAIPKRGVAATGKKPRGARSAAFQKQTRELPLLVMAMRCPSKAAATGPVSPLPVRFARIAPVEARTTATVGPEEVGTQTFAPLKTG